MNWSLVPLTTPQGQIPALVTAAGERASMRFLEFFAANIRNAHTRREHAARLTRRPPQWTARGKLGYRLEISAEPKGVQTGERPAEPAGVRCSAACSTFRLNLLP